MKTKRRFPRSGPFWSGMLRELENTGESNGSKDNRPCCRYPSQQILLALRVCPACE
jgi:hypothetical protein